MSYRLCNCGVPVAMKTSWTEANPGRRFLACRRRRERGGCGYFDWYDPPQSTTIPDPDVYEQKNHFWKAWLFGFVCGAAFYWFIGA